ncbi:LysR family transcriptional regulator [Amaricoccus macauensis]|uniref:LysR family transcriptional regulator n=1 Tax=Amaricoccus macauensis TaxID=57001 RepID=UPI003C7C6E21
MPDLDDLALFLAVADCESLSAASRETGVPLPTLSRRMAKLERQANRRLFLRGAEGYRLTAEGRALVQEAEGLRAASERLKRWFSGNRAKPRVRITAGSWTTRHLAREICGVWTPEDDWLPEFLATNTVLDLARREADIGIRNRRPNHPWLAGRRTRTLTYGVYARSADIQGFVSLGEGMADTPSERWLRETHAAEIVTTASTGLIALDLARAGLGRIVMPCFAGDQETGLMRLGAAIEALTHEEWLVCHHDARHDPPIRHAIEAITRLLTNREAGRADQRKSL